MRCCLWCLQPLRHWQTRHCATCTAVLAWDPTTRSRPALALPAPGSRRGWTPDLNRPAVAP